MKSKYSFEILGHEVKIIDPVFDEKVAKGIRQNSTRILLGATFMGAALGVGCEATTNPIDPRIVAASQTQAASADVQTQAILAQSTQVAKQGTIVAQSATDVAARFFDTETPKPTATQTATATATATSTATATATAKARVTATKAAVVAGVAVPFVEVSRDMSIKEASTIGKIQVPNPARAPAFPDVAQNGLPAQVEYVPSSANWDVWQTGKGELDVPQFHYKLFTARKVEVDQLGVNMESSEKKGVLVIFINYFGDTAAFKDTTVENGFTVAGRVWDMSTPEKLVTAAQALLDHQIGQMVDSPNGANCSTIKACEQVEYRVVVLGGGQSIVQWGGLYTKGQ